MIDADSVADAGTLTLPRTSAWKFGSVSSGSNSAEMMSGSMAPGPKL